MVTEATSWLLQEVWQEVMRCVSRWDLLQQLHSGGPSDAVIFAQHSESPTNAKKRNFFSLRPSIHKEHGRALLLALRAYLFYYHLSYLKANHL